MGYFEQIARSHTFVFLDSVQFVRSSWQARNRLKASEGSVFWLTVPTDRTTLDTEIEHVRICDREKNWRRKHLSAIQSSLGRGPFFRKYFPIFEFWLNKESTLLADINIALIQEISNLLGLSATFVRSSDLGVMGKRTELVLDICRLLGADKYYSAASAAEYIDESLFTQSNIMLEYQNWLHPIYQQVSAPFVSHLSIVDALMNIGAEATAVLITKQNDATR
jgi:hypothetical protein